MDESDLVHNKPTKYPILYVRWPKPLLYFIIISLLVFFLFTPSIYLTPNAAYNSAFWNSVPCKVTNNTHVLEEEGSYFITLTVQYDRDDQKRISDMDVCIGSNSISNALNCSLTNFPTNISRTCVYHKYANVETLEFLEGAEFKSTVLWILFGLYNFAWIAALLLCIVLFVVLLRLCTRHSFQTFNNLCFTPELRSASEDAYENLDKIPKLLRPYLIDVLQDGEQIVWAERQHILMHFPMVYCFLFSTLFIVFGIVLFVCGMLTYVWGLQTGFILFALTIVAFALFLSAIVVPAYYTFHICTSEKLIVLSADLIFISIVYAGYEELLDVEFVSKGRGGSIYWYRALSGGKAGFEYVTDFSTAKKIIQEKIQ